MIYTDKFVWLHFPKCAGTKVENIFNYFLINTPGLHLDYIRQKKDPTISWHNTIKEREALDPHFQLGARTIICCIRKLPSWLESRYSYELWRSPQLQHDPEKLLQGIFLESNGYQNHADQYIEKYLPPEIFISNKVVFIRIEFFREDFIKAFRPFLNLSSIPDHEFNKKSNRSNSLLKRLSLKKQFMAKLYYSPQKELTDRLKERLQTSVYQHCPKWHALESQLYP